MAANPSAALPFDFDEREEQQSDSATLSFAFGKSSDTGDGNVTSPSTIVAYGLWVGSTPSHSVSLCNKDTTRALPVAHHFGFDYGVTVSIVQRFDSITEHFESIAHRDSGQSTTTQPIASCHRGSFADITQFSICTGSDTVPVIDLDRAANGYLSSPIDLAVCTGSDTPPVIDVRHCIAEKGMAYVLYKCFYGDTVPTLPVPCKWYDIELDDDSPPPYQPPCGLPPPSDALPFNFDEREAQSPDSDMLYFDFACHYIPKPKYKKTYMIFNNLSAEIDGQPIDFYTAKISASLDSFCWQFEDVEIRYDDVDKLRLDSRDDAPLLTLNINGHQWIMLIEAPPGERKAFNRDSYTLTGRSRTALLTGDHVKPKTELITSDLYASQLAQAQLAGTGFSLIWDSDADWFIPKNTYTVSGTPMDVIMDIAEASGHYVASHPTDPVLYIRKRYPIKAWELASTTPSRQLSPLIWTTLSGNPRVKPKYNSVRLSGSGNNAGTALVKRDASGSNTLPEAPSYSHVLFAGDASNTPVNALRNKGIQILSDSGTHKVYTVEQLWADDPENPDGIKLGEVGNIDEVLDVGGSLGKGVVTDVSIDVGEENNATEIYQTSVIDVYLGE